MQLFFPRLVLLPLLFLTVSLVSSRGAEAFNQYVIVSCDGERIIIEAGKKDFTILAPGYPASFATNVMVRARDGGTLKSPNKLPVIMKGGDTFKYTVGKPPEDSFTGTIRFHNYEIRAVAPESLILTEDWKNLEAPYGLSISFYALMDGLNCSSDWIVKGVSSNETSRILLRKRVWDVDGWYLPVKDTPRTGVYPVAAHAVTEPRLRDSGSLTIFGCEFEDTAAHSFGFDDFTNWFCDSADNVDDYYGSQSGICTLPYASYIPGNAGRSYLKVLPDRNDARSINISPLATYIRCFPTNTTHDAVIQFDQKEGYTNQVHETDLIASYKSLQLARLRLVPLKEKIRKVAVVSVNGAQSPLSDFSGVNNIFRQCGITYVQSGDVINIQYPVTTTNHVWTSAELDEIYYLGLQNVQLKKRSDPVDFVLFLLDGYDSDEMVCAWGSESHYAIWIYSWANIPIILAHEFGHLESLKDQYLYSSGGQSIQGSDLHNLMNMYDDQWSCGKLRYDQWIKANTSN